jgi:hypothetical protein
VRMQLRKEHDFSVACGDERRGEREVANS